MIPQTSDTWVWYVRFTNGVHVSAAVCCNICMVLSAEVYNKDASCVMCSRTAKERASGSLIAVGMQTDLYNSTKYMGYKHCVYYRNRYEMQSPDKMFVFHVYMFLPLFATSML